MQIFQSTLPRGERPLCVVNKGWWVWISIHAPTRGATRIHWILTISFLFQSTLPRGERRQHVVKIVSADIFQSTLPRGERHCVKIKCLCEMYFNPRSHEGSDNTARLFHSACYNFNPRSHEGSDIDVYPPANKTGISIHAPTRGATTWWSGIWSYLYYFNPRSHEGSDGLKTSLGYNQ